MTETERRKQADKERLEIVVKAWRAYNATKSKSDKVKLSVFIKMMKAQRNNAQLVQNRQEVAAT